MIVYVFFSNDQLVGLCMCDLSVSGRKKCQFINLDYRQVSVCRLVIKVTNDK